MGHFITLYPNVKTLGLMLRPSFGFVRSDLDAVLKHPELRRLHSALAVNQRSKWFQSLLKELSLQCWSLVDIGSLLLSSFMHGDSQGSSLCRILMQ